MGGDGILRDIDEPDVLSYPNIFCGWIPENKITPIIFNQFYKIVEPNVWYILQAVCSSLTALWHWMSLCSAILHD